METKITKARNENRKLNPLKIREHFFNMSSLFFLFSIETASTPIGGGGGLLRICSTSGAEGGGGIGSGNSMFVIVIV